MLSLIIFCFSCSHRSGNGGSRTFSHNHTHKSQKMPYTHDDWENVGPGKFDFNVTDEIYITLLAFNPVTGNGNILVENKTTKKRMELTFKLPKVKYFDWSQTLSYMSSIEVDPDNETKFGTFAGKRVLFRRIFLGTSTNGSKALFFTTNFLGSCNGTTGNAAFGVGFEATKNFEINIPQKISFNA
jgi:hypothetical protein